MGKLYERVLIGFLYSNLDLESFSRSSANLDSKVFTTVYESSSTFFFYLFSSGQDRRKRGGGEDMGVNITEIEI